MGILLYLVPAPTVGVWTVDEAKEGEVSTLPGT